MPHAKHKPAQENLASWGVEIIWLLLSLTTNEHIFHLSNEMDITCTVECNERLQILALEKKEYLPKKDGSRILAYRHSDSTSGYHMWRLEDAQHKRHRLASILKVAGSLEFRDMVGGCLAGLPWHFQWHWSGVDESWQHADTFQGKSCSS